MHLLDLTVEQWQQAAAMHGLLRQTTVLLSLSDAAFDAVHDRDIDLPLLLKTIHRDVLQREHDQRSQELDAQAAQAVSRLLAFHFGCPAQEATGQAAEIKQALGFSHDSLVRVMTDTFKAGYLAAKP